MVDGRAQAFHRRGHAVRVVEDRRTRHQHGGAGPNDQGGRRRVDASIDFHLAAGLASFDELAHPLDLRQRRPDELLVPETRIHGHDQHLVQVLNDLLQHGRRRRRVDGDSGALAERPDPLHRAVQIVVALPVDEERIGAGLDELVQKEIGIRDHQMDLERELGRPPKGLDDRRAHGQIRHEMSVHHVDVDPVGSSLFRLGYLLAQPGEVRGENRRGELHGVLRSHVLDASKML